MTHEFDPPGGRTLTHQGEQEPATLAHPGPALDPATLEHAGPPEAGTLEHAGPPADAEGGTTPPPSHGLTNEAGPPVSATPEPREWRVGDLIDGRYEVRALLGRGGMGQVVRVHHLGWGVDLAVKTPLPKLIGDPAARARFLREADTWVALGLHPNVVACWYVRELEGLPRLFLDHVSGGSLKQAMREGRVRADDVPLVLDLAIQACDGLAHAHRHGVIHRDVKPANLLLSEDGRLQVTDFGLVRRVGEEEVAQVAARPIAPTSRAETPTYDGTITGHGLGTPEYAAPEQWSAAHTADARADVYALGVTLFELVCGRRPFDEPAHPEPAAALIARHMTEPAPDARAFAPALPEPLARLIAACLSKSPERRPASATAVRAELSAIHQTVTGRRARPEPRPAVLRAGALNNRGVSLCDLGRPQPARAAWDEALALDPHHAEAAYNRALMGYRSGDPVAGELARLEQRRGAEPSASLRAGLLELERLSPPAAVARLADALEQPGHAADPLPWQALGHALLALERPVDAAAALAEALARAPEDHATRALHDQLRAGAPLPAAPRPRDPGALIGWPAGYEPRGLAATPDGRVVLLAAGELPTGQSDPAAEPATRLAVVPAVAFATPLNSRAAPAAPPVRRLYGPGGRPGAGEPPCPTDNTPPAAPPVRRLYGPGGRPDGEPPRRVDNAPPAAPDVRRVHGPGGRADAGGAAPDGVRLAGAPPAGEEQAASRPDDRPARPADSPLVVALARAVASAGLAIRAAAPGAGATIYLPGRAAPRGAVGDALAALLAELPRVAPAAEMWARGNVTGVAITPDGALAATVSAQGHLELFVLRTGGCRRSFELKGRLHAAVALVPDGSRAVVAAGDGTLALWDLAAFDLPDARPVELEARGAVALAGDPTAPRVASGHADGRVLLWDLARGRASREILAAGARIEALAFAPDGRRLAATAADGRLHVADLAGGAVRVEAAHPGRATAVAFSPDGATVATAGADHAVRTFALDALSAAGDAPVRTGRGRRRLEAFDATDRLALLPDGWVCGMGASRFLALALDADRKLARAPFLVCRGQAAAEHEALARRFDDLIESARQAVTRRDVGLAMAFTGAARAVAGFEHDPEALALEARAAAGLPRLRLREAWLRGGLGWHPRPLAAMALAGRALVTVAEDSGLRVFDRDTEACVLTLHPHPAPPRALAVSPDAMRAVTGDATGAVWLVPLSGGAARQVGQHRGPVHAVSLLDEHRAASAADDGVRVWDLATAAPLASVDRPARALCFRAGRLLFASGRNLAIWDPRAGAVPERLGTAPADLELIESDPHAELILTAGADRSLSLWRRGAAQPVSSYVGHEAPVAGLALASDHAFAFSAGRDGVVIAWQLASGAPHRVLPRAGEGLTALCLDPAGPLLTAGQQVRTWDLDWEHEVPGSAF